jgi:quercetin dioxygenase-like cupin family protein
MSTPDPLQIIRPPSAQIDADCAPLLSAPFSRALADDSISREAAVAIRGRLAGRVAAALEAESPMFTVPRRRAPRVRLGDGCMVQPLYRASRAGMPRPGEPMSSCLVELAPGAVVAASAVSTAAPSDVIGLHRECLVLTGRASLGGCELSERDYAAYPAGSAMSQWTSDEGALLFYRESAGVPDHRMRPSVVRDAEAGWADFAPGIWRRVLWQHDGQAAMLYLAQPGARVPQHAHGNDEECLIAAGELFLDDLLLQVGDYQLAPAGTGHRMTETDTGVVIYAHGDLDLRFV